MEEEPQGEFKVIAQRKRAKRSAIAVVNDLDVQEYSDRVDDVVGERGVR